MESRLVEYGPSRTAPDNPWIPLMTMTSKRFVKTYDRSGLDHQWVIWVFDNVICWIFKITRITK